MKRPSHFATPISASAVAGMCALALPPGARAQTAVDPDAQGVLAAMPGHLGGLERFSVEYSAADEVISAEGQKLQFLHSGEITVQRPGRLYATRRGSGHRRGVPRRREDHPLRGEGQCVSAPAGIRMAFLLLGSCNLLFRTFASFC
jgi:hypothetical protein